MAVNHGTLWLPLMKHGSGEVNRVILYGMRDINDEDAYRLVDEVWHSPWRFVLRAAYMLVPHNFPNYPGCERCLRRVSIRRTPVFESRHKSASTPWTKRAVQRTEPVDNAVSHRFESNSNRLGVAKGVGLHAVVLVDFGHLTVLSIAIERRNSHLFSSTGPGDEKADGDGAEEQADRAGHRDESDGHNHQRNADEESDEPNAKAGGDVLAPGGKEGGFAGLEGVADGLAFQDEVWNHEEGHDPPRQSTNEVDDGSHGRCGRVVAAASGPFKRLEQQTDGSSDDAPHDDDGQALDGCTHAVSELGVAPVKRMLALAMMAQFQNTTMMLSTM